MQERKIITEVDYDAIRAILPEYEDRIRAAHEAAIEAEKRPEVSSWNLPDTPEMKALVAVMDEAQAVAEARM